MPIEHNWLSLGSATQPTRYFFGRPPHISSSAKGWIGPLGFGLGRDLITASAK
jgi:hypothetical protein